MKIIVLTVVFGLATWSPVLAANYSVVNTNDGGAGSLRQAILDANASTGVPDTITFAITNLATTISPATALPAIGDPVTIDGYTQPGAAANSSAAAFNGVVLVRLSGSSAGTGANGLLITNGNSTVRGLMITGFNGDGIEISGPGGNIIEGCVIGLTAAGADAGNSANGVFISGSSSNVIGGASLGSRNVISGNNSDGVEISGALALGNHVLNNLIGTDQNGLLDRGNTGDGVFVTLAGLNTIGGTVAGTGNLISGNNDNGIELSGVSATNNVVVGNIIGMSASGSGLPNSGSGVAVLATSHDNVIGGILAGEPNVIAFNSGDGIEIGGNGNTNNVCRGNSIFSNVGLGIDLGASGVAANDAGDADGGANLQQNFPVVTAVSNSASAVFISGTLNSRPSTTYSLDFYSSVAADGAGYGQGRFYLGSADYATDAASNLVFAVSFPGVLQGRFVTATATDPFGNTSEFSAAVPSQTLVPGQTFTVVNTNNSGPGSLRDAIEQANLTVTVRDTIVFAITNLSTTISPSPALPAISDRIVIDGYTQAGAAANTASSGFNGVVPVRISGSSAGTGANGLTITAGDSIVRGLMITGFNGDGIEISSLGSNVVEGCLIGLSAAGADLGNSANGVFVSGSSNNVVGGTVPAARNAISGNNNDGIEISGTAAVGNRVLGNLIGTDFSGATAVPNGGHGVLITGGSHENLVGGVLAGEANVIAFNGSAGISVAAAAANVGNTFRGNTIFSNGGLGIDLGAAGATLNDATDADAGANQLQNFPVISAVTTNTSADATISGSLTSAANTSYIVDFYANAVLDVSGHGEGQFHLGSTQLTTDGAGQASFAVSLGAGLPGRYVSATATDPLGNTSEFSRWAVAVSSNPSTNITFHAADFVFIIDASSSMGGEIAAVKNGLGSFVTSLNTASIDARFAIVLFGGPPELILDWTTDQATTEAMFDVISVSGAVPGVHNNHNLNPEAGLEAIRMVLNAAGTNMIQRNYSGGAGPIAFRPDARKNLILVTDENSDLPYYPENRQVGQTGTEPPSPLTAPWLAEVDVTAQAVITNAAFLNLLINPSGIIRNQYGDPSQSVADANFLNFDPDATLTNLINAGFGASLEAQVLAAGLVGRAFNITAVNTTNFIQNFFAAKVEEIIHNPPPRPRLNIERLSEAVRLTWTTNAVGYLLETNQMLSTTNWGVLTTNYSIIGTNFAVTNAAGNAARFYRLRK